MSKPSSRQKKERHSTLSQPSSRFGPHSITNGNASQALFEFYFKFVGPPDVIHSAAKTSLRDFVGALDESQRAVQDWSECVSKPGTEVHQTELNNAMASLLFARVQIYMVALAFFTDLRSTYRNAVLAMQAAMARQSKQHQSRIAAQLLALRHERAALAEQKEKLREAWAYMETQTSRALAPVLARKKSLKERGLQQADLSQIEQAEVQVIESFRPMKEKLTFQFQHLGTAEASCNAQEVDVMRNQTSQSPQAAQTSQDLQQLVVKARELDKDLTRINSSMLSALLKAVDFAQQSIRINEKLEPELKQQLEKCKSNASPDAVRQAQLLQLQLMCIWLRTSNMEQITQHTPGALTACAPNADQVQAFVYAVHQTSHDQQLMQAAIRAEVADLKLDAEGDFVLLDRNWIWNGTAAQVLSKVVEASASKSGSPRKLLRSSNSTDRAGSGRNDARVKAHDRCAEGEDSERDGRAFKYIEPSTSTSPTTASSLDDSSLQLTTDSESHEPVSKSTPVEIKDILAYVQEPLQQEHGGEQKQLTAAEETFRTFLEMRLKHIRGQSGPGSSGGGGGGFHQQKGSKRSSYSNPGFAACTASLDTFVKTMSPPGGSSTCNSSGGAPPGNADRHVSSRFASGVKSSNGGALPRNTILEQSVHVRPAVSSPGIVSETHDDPQTTSGHRALDSQRTPVLDSKHVGTDSHASSIQSASCEASDVLAGGSKAHGNKLLHVTFLEPPESAIVRSSFSFTAPPPVVSMPAPGRAVSVNAQLQLTGNAAAAAALPAPISAPPHHHSRIPAYTPCIGDVLNVPACNRDPLISHRDFMNTIPGTFLSRLPSHGQGGRVQRRRYSGAHADFTMRNYACSGHNGGRGVARCCSASGIAGLWPLPEPSLPPGTSPRVTCSGHERFRAASATTIAAAAMDMSRAASMHSTHSVHGRARTSCQATNQALIVHRANSSPGASNRRHSQQQTTTSEGPPFDRRLDTVSVSSSGAHHHHHHHHIRHDDSASYAVAARAVVEDKPAFQIQIQSPFCDVVCDIIPRDSNNRLDTVTSGSMQEVTGANRGDDRKCMEPGQPAVMATRRSTERQESAPIATTSMLAPLPSVAEDDILNVATDHMHVTGNAVGAGVAGNQAAAVGPGAEPGADPGYVHQWSTITNMTSGESGNATSNTSDVQIRLSNPLSEIEEVCQRHSSRGQRELSNGNRPSGCHSAVSNLTHARSNRTATSSVISSVISDDLDGRSSRCSSRSLVHANANPIMPSMKRRAKVVTDPAVIQAALDKMNRSFATLEYKRPNKVKSKVIMILEPDPDLERGWFSIDRLLSGLTSCLRFRDETAVKPTRAKAVPVSEPLAKSDQARKERRKPRSGKVCLDKEFVLGAGPLETSSFQPGPQVSRYPNVKNAPAMLPIDRMSISRQPGIRPGAEGVTDAPLTGLQCETSRGAIIDMEENRDRLAAAPEVADGLQPQAADVQNSAPYPYPFPTDKAARQASNGANDAISSSVDTEMIAQSVPLKMDVEQMTVNRHDHASGQRASKPSQMKASSQALIKTSPTTRSATSSPRTPLADATHQPTRSRQQQQQQQLGSSRQWKPAGCSSANARNANDSSNVNDRKLARNNTTPSLDKASPRTSTPRSSSQRNSAARINESKPIASTRTTGALRSSQEVMSQRTVAADRATPPQRRATAQDTARGTLSALPGAGVQAPVKQKQAAKALNASSNGRRNTWNV